MKKDKTDHEFDELIGTHRPKELTKKEHDEVREARFKLYNERSQEDKIKDILLGFRFSVRNYAETENPKEIILLGEFLYGLLSQIKIKKRIFAEYIGISPQNINKYFNGERKFAIEHLLKLEKLFDVPAEILLEVQSRNELMQIKRSHKGEYEKYKLEDLLAV